MPYALLIGILVAFTALIPIFGAFIGCVVGSFFDLHGKSKTSSFIYYYIFTLTAD